MANGENSFVSLKWIVTILLAIVFAASGLIIGDTRAGISEAKQKIEKLQEDKIGTKQYYNDISDIKESLKQINEKMDKLRK